MRVKTTVDIEKELDYQTRINFMRLCKTAAEGDIARASRDALAAHLWSGNAKLTHEVIAELMTKGSKSGGGPELTRNAVQKLIARHEKAVA